ncbi:MULTISPECIES: DUF6262 family protein [Mycobacteriaceae]|jgi:hypothetical protein|uniref:DUF6262 family protein n=1 Tax=Mycobacteriaceae TaxID=1762 RepID=UPI000ABB4CA6|nr:MULTISPECIES: DUF6262 family protein [Mycobacteriaceae]
MPDHLRDAARKRHDDAVIRADRAVSALARRGAPINFVQVAREAGVSTDFLYRQPELRRRIEQLRVPRSRPTGSGGKADEPATTSSAVRALSAQIKQLRRKHRDEVTRLKDALAVAHGENLALRRRLATYE